MILPVPALQERAEIIREFRNTIFSRRVAYFFRFMSSSVTQAYSEWSVPTR
jgi:hypothetical protein